ncbi:putative transcription factor 25 [Erysiphe necator]|uniref:Putative transcription factor 25 n=1 Tax=Uncinula necator TaxID=52586 RepID=A0A0B1P4I9_UNCNE|nr:putative transcription factor 25 [Erysiphe necator]
MSTRQLRKLQKQKELEIAALSDKGQAEVEDESEDSFSLPRSKGNSIFANLRALEDFEDVDEDILEKNEVEIEPVDITPRFISRQEKTRKLKHKKGKKKQNRKPEIKPEDRVGGEEIERALRQLGIKTQSDEKSRDSRTRQVDDPIEKICTLVSINERYLKVGNEMRKLFGKVAVEEKTDPSEITVRENTQRQQLTDETFELETVLRGNNPPGKGISDIILRRNFFIQGRSDWPKGLLGGLSMEVVKYEQSDGIVEFRYVHNQNYQKVQNLFHRGVEIADPQLLVSLLVKNPDHISLLLQVSKIAKSLGNHSLSSDLLERALFFFGKAATSQFTCKLSQGKARLNFARFENRELWLAGYNYIKSLMMKGTYRTALEWAKLLLSLNPGGDPYCMRLLIHNLSLRCHEYEWLFDLYDTGFHYQWSNNTGLMSKNLYSHTKISLALAAIHMKNREKAREILRESMIRLPWLYYCLFSELNLEIPPSLSDHCEPNSEADALFAKIYINQTKDLWDTPETTSLLMETGYTITKFENPVDCSDVVSLDVVRFIYLDGSSETLALIPRERMNFEVNSDSDPIPPSENIISYEIQQVVIRDNHQHHPDYLVIGRLNTNQGDDDDENSDTQFTIEMISEEGIQRLLPIESARRLFRHLWGPSNFRNEGNDNNHVDNIEDTHNDSHNHEEENNNYDDENKSEDEELLKDTTNQNPSHLNSDDLND